MMLIFYKKNRHTGGYMSLVRLELTLLASEANALSIALQGREPYFTMS